MPLESLDPDYLSQPLPPNLRRLEAGYDSACRVGSVADIQIGCPDGDDLGLYTIVRNAPVIATDPEGFTVVIISAEDHRRLTDHDLFWARCANSN